MAEPHLGELKTVDARSVFANEAQDFTPWLRDNAELLGKALGLDIEVTTTEAPVGPFAVDLLGTDVGHTRALIVENQLEQTNHAHLGQLITYAAGLEAGAIIWITPQFRDEHRQALDWLNLHTSEGIDFFGVEFELLQVDDSLPAPHFKLVSQPNEWAKVTRTAGAAAQGEPSERGLRYKQFFEAALNDLKQMKPGLTNATRAQPDSWFSMAAGRGGFSFEWVFRAGGLFRTQLLIASPDGARNSAFYRALLARKQDIESQLGFPIAWEPLEHAQSCRVAVERTGSIDDSPEQLTGLREWAVKKMIILNSVLRPILQTLEPAVASADTDDGESVDHASQTGI